MPRRAGAPHEGDDGALEATWGREASARAAPVDRPPPARPAPTRPNPDPTRWRAVAVGGAVVAVVAVVAVIVVLPGSDDESDREPATTTADPTSTTVPPWEPAWVAEVACARIEVTAERRTTACPVATDADRAYVIEERDDLDALGTGRVATVVAFDAADGGVEWAVSFADGATSIRRDPSTLLVVGPRDTHGVDPDSGLVRWTRPGVPLAPLGETHLLLDDVDLGPGGEETATMSVVDAVSGEVRFSRSGASSAFFVHPCGDAGMVVVSEGETLTAHDVRDGAERWSVPADPHDGSVRVLCTADAVVEARGNLTLATRDTQRGELDGSPLVVAPSDQGLARIVEVAGETVVVSTSDRIEGYEAGPGLLRRWSLDVEGGGRDVVVAPVATGVGVAVPGDRAAWFGPDGTPGPQLPFVGQQELVIDGARLVAWGSEEVLVASAAELTRARRLPLPDVRRAAAAPTHVVVTTRDEVRLYPFDP